MPSPIVAIPRRMNFGRPQTTRLGPWPRGLDQRFSPEAVGAQALPFASNVDVMPSGELRQRPPLRRLDISNIFGKDTTLQTLTDAQASWRFDATYEVSNAIAATGVAAGSGTSLMTIGHTSSSNWIVFTNLTGGIAGTPQDVYKVQIITSNIVIYNNKAWGIVQQGTQAGAVGTAGQVWSIDLNNLTTGPTFYNTGPTASGTAFPCRLTIIKDRMYAWNYIYGGGAPDYSSNVNTIWFSKTGNPAVFTGDPDAGFFGLSNSDAPNSGNIPVAVVGLRNVIYIFSRATTWTLSLPSSGIPTNGVLQVISKHIGAFDDNSVASYDNKIYVGGAAGIYEILNGQFIDIGYTLGSRLREFFSNEALGNTTLSIAEERLWFVIAEPFTDYTQFPTTTYDPPVDTFYVFNLKSRAWSSYGMGPPPNYFGTAHTWQTYMFAPLKVISFSSVSTTGAGGVRITTVIGGQTTQNYFFEGCLMMDTSSGALYYFKETEPSTDKTGGGPQLPEYQRLPWADIWDTFSTGVNSIQQPIPITVWTSDNDGATVETASWKRYYAVVINLFTPKWVKDAISASCTLTLTDHNGNTITDAAINFNTVQGQYYYSIKAYTSLRARHLQYKVTINPGTTGPFSLLSFDVLAKLKQNQPDVAVSG